MIKISENPHPLAFKTTFDWYIIILNWSGVQTNLGGHDNPEADISGLDELMVKKRQKRREYKKRKKMQKKMM